MERSSLVTILVCLTLFGYVASWQVSTERPIKSLAEAGQRGQSLRLSAAIIAQRYCKADSGIDGVDLRLLLTFSNQGTERIQLYKSSSPVLRYVVSRTSPEAARQEQVMSVSSTQYFGGPQVQLDDDFFAKHFVLLAPGKTYQLESNLRVFASRQSEPKDKSNYLEPGQYLLQIEVGTWPASATFEQTHLERPQRTALVWHRPVTSEPFPLTIDAHRQVEDCSPFKELLDTSLSDPNARNADGLTALLIVITYPDRNRFLSLLAAGADVNLGTNSGITPLMLAASYSDSFFLSQLIKHGANLNASSQEGTTALIDAIRAGVPENVRLLIRAGADVNVRSKDGRNALALSSEISDAENRAEIARLLRSAGARD